MQLLQFIFHSCTWFRIFLTSFLHMLCKILLLFIKDIVQIHIQFALGHIILGKIYSIDNLLSHSTAGLYCIYIHCFHFVFLISLALCLVCKLCFSSSFFFSTATTQIVDHQVEMSPGSMQVQSPTCLKVSSLMSYDCIVCQA